MRLAALAFVIGTLMLQHASALPEWRAGLASTAALLAVVLLRRARGGRASAARCALILLAGGLAGYGWSSWRAEMRLADALPHEWEGRDVQVRGVVAGLPQVTPRGTRFMLAIEAVETDGARVPALVSLTWYPERAGGESLAPPEVAPAERWRFVVRLKRPRGLGNPHAFDFEPWALERGIRATGYVRSRDGFERLDARVDGWPQTLHRWRGEVRASMRSHLADARFAGVLVALAIGDQDAIPGDQWQVFWRTGVGHLMSISGLHITMIAALAFALVFFAWARVPGLALRIPARKAAVVAGAGAALAYALMTGFAVPAQRTFIMLAAIGACVLAERHGSASRVLAIAAVAVLGADPWAALSAGFWLSYGAVAAIFYALALRTGARSPVRTALSEQLAVTLAMLPMLVALFQEVSVISPVANALAIPLVSLAIVPLTLAGAFLPLPLLLDVAHGLMSFLMSPLEHLAALPFAMLESHAPVPWTLAAAIVGVLWLLAPRGVPMRACGLAWLAPLFAVTPPGPGRGEAWVDLLDVGHGLAVVVRTSDRALVYDAGPTWGPESDSGARIVVPFLRGEGVRRLEGLVVSHADDDHAGGAASVARSRAPPWMLSSLRQEHALHSVVARSLRCSAGQRWSWDGVTFEVLHPAAAMYEETNERRPRKENDRGCVLRVATAGGSALLTGDVEARAEGEIVARGGNLRADVLLVPHHGSRTSSTPAFLDAVAPSLALLAVGYRNRFRHPHETIVARYRERGVAIRRTDQEGAIRVRLPRESSSSIGIEAYSGRRRYWSERRGTE